MTKAYDAFVVTIVGVIRNGKGDCSWRSFCIAFVAFGATLVATLLQFVGVEGLNLDTLDQVQDVVDMSGEVADAEADAAIAAAEIGVDGLVDIADAFADLADDVFQLNAANLGLHHGGAAVVAGAAGADAAAGAGAVAADGSASSERLPKMKRKELRKQKSKARLNREELAYLEEHPEEAAYLESPSKYSEYMTEDKEDGGAKGGSGGRHGHDSAPRIEVLDVTVTIEADPDAELLQPGAPLRPVPTGRPQENDLLRPGAPLQPVPTGQPPDEGEAAVATALQAAARRRSDRKGRRELKVNPSPPMRPGAAWLQIEEDEVLLDDGGDLPSRDAVYQFVRYRPRRVASGECGYAAELVRARGGEPKKPEDPKQAAHDEKTWNGGRT